MSAAHLEIMLVGATTAAACALLGTFLVLRRLALISDAISHSILLGIVAAFFLVRDLNSPLLVVGAALVGVLTVWLIELVVKTRRVANDAAIGLVFPVLFSIAVIIITRAASDIHLDTDMVLVGQIDFVPFDRLAILGIELPRALWAMGAILIINIIFITLFYKELKLVTFDTGLAAALGFMPVLLHYAIVTLTSITAVGAFDAVGSILVVALMIAPPATAYLLTDRLGAMLLLSAVIGVLSAAIGFWPARWLNVSTAGMMVVVTGVFFLLALVLAPTRGLLPQWLRRRRQRWEFAAQLLSVHLLHHENTPHEAYECSHAHLETHMRWSPEYANRVLGFARRHGWVRCDDERLHLTERGRETALLMLVRS